MTSASPPVGPGHSRDRWRAFWQDLNPMVPMIPIAALVGFISANAVEGFRRAMYLLIGLYSEHEHLVAEGLPDWLRVAIPTLCATASGLVLWGGRRWCQQRRNPEYMEAVLVGDGRLPFGPNIIRTLSSLTSVAGGITIGREGTMIQFAALVSSVFGRGAWLRPEFRRLMVACGAAAGFASAYHAPIAATLFVAEIVLGGLALREITALLVAAIAGELTTQALYASGPLYQSMPIPTVDLGGFVGATLLGLVCGILGPAFLWLLETTHRVMQDRVASPTLRMGLAGLLIGLLSVVTPAVWGNGYSVVQLSLLDPWTLSAVAMVFALRLVAVTAASAAGIPGGVLTPTLALGGGLGIIAYHLLPPGLSGDSQALCVLVGMGGLLAATTHAPAMAAIMMFETTRQYDAIFATIPACAVAALVGRMLRARSVYSDALGPNHDTPAPAAAAPPGGAGR